MTIVFNTTAGKVSGLTATTNSATTYYSPALPDEEYNTEDYDNITENIFLKAIDNRLSTFSIDVDAASYSNVRRIFL